MTQHPHDKTSDVEHGLVRTDAQEGGVRVDAVTDALRASLHNRDGRELYTVTLPPSRRR